LEGKVAAGSKFERQQKNFPRDYAVSVKALNQSVIIAMKFGNIMKKQK
jgi:hypothetical protein